MEALVGDNIGGFVIKEVIHQGTWGNVYKVQPRDINQIYALKMATSIDSRRRLYTEREILDKIGNHENITKIYFCGDDVNAGSYDNGSILPSGEREDGDGFFYIVEEYASTNLRKKLDEWTNINRAWGETEFPSFDCTIGIIKQILGGLKHAHSQKVIHQDLKPENILLTKDGKGEKSFKVQLCDFGLAYLLDSEALESSLDDAKTVAGSIHYLSPEQRSGKKIDSRTDLYNVGLIFYELLTYKRPTINLVKPTVVRAKLRAAAPYSSKRPESLPGWVDDFIFKTLSADPADRYKDADEMLKAIDKAMKPIKPVQAWVEPAPEPTLTERALGNIKSGISFTGKKVWGLVKLVALAPFAVFFAPFVFMWKALDSDWAHREGAEPPVVIAALIWAAFWYIGLVPYCFELNVRHQLAKSPPSGTILYYNNQENQQGFYFVRGDALPEIKNFHIETPEIPRSATGENGSSFQPKYALSLDGNSFYYTTPTGLTRIRLDVPKTSSDFRKTVVKSEVFNYFSILNFVDGPQGEGLYAKLKNETWFITKEGLLQQTSDSISIDNYTKKSNGDFYVDGSTVAFNSNLPGNTSIGSGGWASVWYPQTLKPAFGWSEGE